jgi:hypothetical protein
MWVVEVTNFNYIWYKSTLKGVHFVLAHITVRCNSLTSANFKSNFYDISENWLIIYRTAACSKSAAFSFKKFYVQYI